MMFPLTTAPILSALLLLGATLLGRATALLSDPPEPINAHTTHPLLSAVMFPHLNHTGLITINGANAYTYTVQFIERGDTVERTTSYFNKEKHLVRREITRYHSSPLVLFSNHVEDFRTGELLIQTASLNRFTAQRRERTGSKMEENSVTAENAIVGTLVSEYVRQNIPTLERGAKAHCTMAMPLRGIVTEMTVTKERFETVQGVECITLKLEPVNFILKAIMGEASLFTFERAKPYRFMKYQGILGVPTSEGKQQNGIAHMKY